MQNKGFGLFFLSSKRNLKCTWSVEDSVRSPAPWCPLATMPGHSDRDAPAGPRTPAPPLAARTASYRTATAEATAKGTATAAREASHNHDTPPGVVAASPVLRRERRAVPRCYGPVSKWTLATVAEYCYFTWVGDLLRDGHVSS